MTSYNQVNGIYANEHPHLLKEILRKEWGFCGAVITDWGGSNDHCAGVKNGSSLEMPAPGLSSAAALLKGVEEGRITEQDLDERVEEILNLLPGQKKMFKQNKMPENSPEREPLYEAHHHLARRACAESVVLLKNETDTLPLKSGTRIAVIGDFAYESRYQGAGSSMVNAWKVDSVKECLEGETGLEWKKWESLFPVFQEDISGMEGRMQRWKKRLLTWQKRQIRSCFSLGSMKPGRRKEWIAAILGYRKIRFTF